MFKKTFTVAVVLLIALLLVSCGGTKKPVADSTNTNTTPVTDTPQTPDPQTPTPVDPSQTNNQTQSDPNAVAPAPVDGGSYRAGDASIISEGTMHALGTATGMGGGGRGGMQSKAMRMMGSNSYEPPPPPPPYGWNPPPDFNTEDYSRIYENEFLAVVNNPLSTFSIDVDVASYANSRRYITGGSLPPKDAVRIEEFINYFKYEYPDPKGEHPFSVFTEVSTCPWKPEHRLLAIGLQGKKIDKANFPNQNLVFLLDVSGSMDQPNKLPLLKSAFRLLVSELTEKDKVSIVVYAGSAGVVLPATAGNHQETILNALDRLSAGGSTAGGEGIVQAYTIAKQNFIKGGNNRVILATDGDFNIGASSDADLVRMIEEKRNDGIFLSILGFGMGNYKDNKMEQLANKGNGNYAYIDNILEAKKVLVTEMGGTLLTIAKDVKLQLEFNPAKVQAYRLIGYENRRLRNEEFNDDTKDAGEMGSGHTVTALYEIVPPGVKIDLPSVDSLKYQKPAPTASKSPEMLTVKLRYKPPTEDVSKLLAVEVVDRDTPFERTSENFRWATAVVEFGQLLRDSKFKGDVTYDKIIAHAKAAKGKDDNGYRAEFIRLVENAQLIK